MECSLPEKLDAELHALTPLMLSGMEVIEPSRSRYDACDYSTEYGFHANESIAHMRERLGKELTVITPEASFAKRRATPEQTLIEIMKAVRAADWDKSMTALKRPLARGPFWRAIRSTRCSPRTHGTSRRSS